MSNETLSLGIPYLGFLSGRLGDLAGYATMANELIQNADDATGATAISFDVTDAALIVDNNGVFTDCGEQHLTDCPWLKLPEKGHRCDFHRFRLTSSHDKANEDEVTGAFGIGFISVYQITDHPELISSNRHWRLRPELPETERILVLSDYPADFVGTRFILPWAFDASSTLRQQPSFDIVTREKIQDLLNTLTKALFSAVIFLKKIQVIELKENGKTVKRIERLIDKNQVVIEDEKGQTQLWHVFEGDFKNHVVTLKKDYPTKIHAKRSTIVQIAFPEAGVKFDDGLYHATLPTQDLVGLPMHINATFFPSSDRKSLLLDDTYKAEWNYAAIRGAAETLLAVLPKLPECMGHEGLWKLFDRAYSLFEQKFSQDKKHALTKNIFWETIRDSIKLYPVLYTSAGEWRNLDEARLLNDKKDESVCLPVLEQMGAQIVHPDLNSYFNVLRKLNVNFLDSFYLASRLTELGLVDTLDLNEAPVWLQPAENRELLGKEISLLLGRLTRPLDKQEASQQLSKCTLALSQEGRLCPPYYLRKGSRETVALFNILNAQKVFLGSDNPEGISQLVSEFSVEDAAELLEKAPVEERTEIWLRNPSEWIMVFKWMEENFAQFRNNTELKNRISNLEIWPSGTSLCSLTKLAIPGNFVDPLDLASVIDGRFLQECRRFIIDDLHAQPLDVRTYAKVWVKKAFEPGGHIPPEKRQKLNLVLAEKIGELLISHEAQQALASCPLVLCVDKEYYQPNETYFIENDDIEDLLGSDIHVAHWLGFANPQGVKKLWEWLGVKSEPRPSDVVQRIRNIVHNGPPTPENRATIQKIFLALGRRWPKPDFPNTGIRAEEYTELKFEKWIPVENDPDNWHLPQTVYASYQMESFASQANFLDVNRNEQGYVRDFIGYLNIGVAPSAKQVVDHLFYLMKQKKPAHSSIYAFLNNNADDIEVRRLQNTACLFVNQVGYISAERVFWNIHPFGRYRNQLSETERRYQNFYKEMGVKETPDARDAIEVLKEISQAYLANKESFDQETENVVMQCWKLLADSYAKEWVDDNELKSALAGQRVIPNAHRELMPPSWMLFKDRPRLAEKYGQYLEKNVIDKLQGIWEVMRAAGVNLLSEQINYNLVRCINPVLSSDLTDRLKERQSLITRVVEGQKLQNWDLEILTALELHQVDELLVQFTVKIDSRESRPFDDDPNAYFDREGTRIYFKYGDRIPWDAIAREITYALNPETEASQVSPGIKEVLSAETAAHAQDSLDELGIAPLEKEFRFPKPETVTKELGAGDISNAETDDLSGATSEAGNNSSGISPEYPNNESADGVHDTNAATTSGTVSDNGDGDRVPNHRNEEGGSSSNLPQGDRKKSSSPKIDKNAGKARGPKNQTKFSTYVYVREESSEEENSSTEVDPEVNDAGVRAVLKFESQARPTRQPEDANQSNPNNPGYDIVSRDMDGEIVRYIEIKSTAGKWGERGVALSAMQFKQALELGELFWLYIVEDALSSAPNIICIQNPARRVGNFVYDVGWRSLASEEVIHRPRSILDIRRQSVNDLDDDDDFLDNEIDE